MTIFPDDPSRVQILNLRVVGVFRSVAPMEPFAELFMPTTSFPAPLPPPDFYLARVAPGSSTAAVAAEARRQLPTYTVTTLRTLRISQERALTALNVRKLGQLQIVAAGLVAAVGVAVLGAFLVLERRRESIILRPSGRAPARSSPPRSSRGRSRRSAGSRSASRSASASGRSTSRSWRCSSRCRPGAGRLRP